MTPRFDGLLPIREVARLTGVNAVTLRAWERRYGLIEPHRTEKGHRLYTLDNLDRVRAILTWLARGVNVGQVKGLLEQECAQAEHPGVTPWGMLRNELLEGLRRFDMSPFEQQLQRYREHYCSTLICEQVFEPLLEHMQQRWQGQFGSQLEEVFFHTWLRDQIAAWMRSCSGASEAGSVVLANLSAEHYEPAMWLLAALLADQGVAVRLLEWEFPASELTLLHDQSSLCAVVFYSSQALPPHQLKRHLPKLGRHLPGGLFIAGPAAAIHREQWPTLGVSSLGTLPSAACRQLIQTLRGAEHD